MGANKTYHTQCEIVHSDGRVQVTWLPSIFAIKGRQLSLKEVGEFEDGWEVREVYSTLPSSEVVDRSRDYLNTRQASDI